MTNEENDPDLCSDLEEKIFRQIEYYFGDYNLMRDKFLQETIKTDNGWVPFTTLTKFNRLKQLTTEFDVIINALRKSKTGLLELSEDGKSVRRSPDKPLPENDAKRKEDVNSRSVYVKAFPTETTLDELLQFFKEHGPVEHIQMRYLRVDKGFKGSVFALFNTVDEAKAFQTKENVKYGDADLLRELKTDYLQRKFKERSQRKEERKQKKAANSASGDGDVKEENTTEFKSGLILYLSGMPENVTREKLKAAFSKHGQVAWIDFNKGDSQGWIRFREETPASTVVDKLKEANDGVFKFEEIELSHKIIEGEEEETYWKKMAKAKQESLNKKSKSMRGRGKNHFKRSGGRGQYKIKTEEKTDHGDENGKAKALKRPADKSEGVKETPGKVAKIEPEGS